MTGAFCRVAGAMLAVEVVQRYADVLVTPSM